jgi:hypothetical protein
MDRRQILTLTAAGVAAFPAFAPTAQGQFTDGHVEWVAQALMRMQTIKPGMTRDDLLKVFTTEGGISTRTQRTYVSRDCPYFKVDVEFKAVGPPGRNGVEMSFGESSADIVLKISRPYLAFSILD